MKLDSSLPEYRRAEIPRFPGWLAALGPGIVWMALAQGSGELIWWPYLIAKYGLAFLFLLLPACLLQWPLTFEIGRYTLLSGESIWTGFFRLSRWFALPLWLLMAASFLWFGAFASAGGTAMAELTHLPQGMSPRGQSLFWGYAMIAVCTLAVFRSRGIYRLIERVMVAVALVTVVGLLIACTHPSVLEVVPEFLRATVVPAWPPTRPFENGDTSTLLTAVTFAGLGGFWTLFYSYWVREKGVGMAALRGASTRAIDAPDAGLTLVPGVLPLATEGAPGRLRAWTRFLVVDSGIGIFGNIVTTLLTCLLAYAVLLPKGLLPTGWEIATVQSEFFALRWGAVGKVMFLVVAAAFLGDTWLSTADAVARVNTDVIRTLLPGARRKTESRWYRTFFLILTAITCATMPLAQPGALIVISAVLGFFGTVVFSIAVLILNHQKLRRALPDFARPSRIAAGFLTLSCVAYLALAVAYVHTLLR
jgi:Mn2+/Fe2+ NRAMP family transporter